MSHLAKINQYTYGPMKNFGYLLADSSTRQCAVIDPAWDAARIIQEITTHNYSVSAVLLTHGHFDHTNALDDFLLKYPVPVYISNQELPSLTPAVDWLIQLAHQESLSIGSLSVQCLQTPGHTPGGICYFVEHHLITGDSLFIDGCGRCDLEGSNPDHMYDSLFSIIWPLPDDTIIYCGHDYGPLPIDTLGQQKQTNPYLLCQTKEAFIRLRMR